MLLHFCCSCFKRLKISKMNTGASVDFTGRKFWWPSVRVVISTYLEWMGLIFIETSLTNDGKGTQGETNIREDCPVSLSHVQDIPWPWIKASGSFIIFKVQAFTSFKHSCVYWCKYYENRENPKAFF